MLGHRPTLRDADATAQGLATLVAMGKCRNCGVTLDPAWKFCIACGQAVSQAENDIAIAEPASAREPIPSAIRQVAEPDDEPVPRRRADIAVIFGIAMAVGGAVLIILVALALFTPRG